MSKVKYLYIKDHKVFSSSEYERRFPVVNSYRAEQDILA